LTPVSPRTVASRSSCTDHIKGKGAKSALFSFSGPLIILSDSHYGPGNALTSVYSASLLSRQ
ncbi:hypothetical protein, partial [Komagataeibacter sucrofermentans]|uniref:hypothetical protein n=1 Tax=Komagataeibacter sucrofermentans TaxID=1053551 RepID=UPI00223235AF